MNLHTGTPQHASRRQLTAASVVAGLIALVSYLVGRHSSMPLAHIAAFLPMFAATVVLTEGQTAYLLAKQFMLAHDAFLGALSGAYSFTAIMAAVQILVFPGVFSPTGLLGAGPQTAVWMWAFWHAGFPACVTAAMAVRWYAEQSSAAKARRAAKRLAIGAPALAVVLAFLAVYKGSILPPIIAGASYKALSHSPMAGVVVGSNLLALTACLGIGRLRRSIDVWITVAIVASVADASLTLGGGARFTLGWYVARMLSVVSSGVVLCMLINEVSQLYRGLLAANAALSKQAYRDGLTGIANRQSFNERWQGEQNRAVREARPLSVLMLDIDHFKRINDTFGHGDGDACLAAVAAVLKKVVRRRAADFVARFGGEEFVVLLPGTDAAGAAHCGEAIRQAVLDMNWPAPAQSGGRVTVSIGHATYDPLPVFHYGAHAAAELEKAGHILRLADEALYAAKRGGRNRVVASARAREAACEPVMTGAVAALSQVEAAVLG